MLRPRHLALVAATLLAPGMVSDAVAAERANHERSWTPPAAALQWKSALARTRPATALTYRELPLARIVALHRNNQDGAKGVLKVQQIGITRSAGSESSAGRLPALQWTTVEDGGTVTRIEVTSPVALGLRVGLKLDAMHPLAQLRFGGSELPVTISSVLSGAEVSRLADARGVFWTPVTDGETQTIEIYLPPGVATGTVRVHAPELAHLLANSRSEFKIVEKIGESDSCNIDTACRVPELGSAFVRAKNAVAHMVYNVYDTNGVSSGTYVCTGTLLADTVADTQVPWFYSARHCFAGGSEGVPVQDMAKVANSLNTHWGYEATACGNGVQAATVLLSGGADLMHADAVTDAMLLRLRNPAPAGAEFSGWDSAALGDNAGILAIHHPSGDAKKVSSGLKLSTDNEHHMVAWTSGTTERGSSGSGLFTLDASGYRLRGGLYGGDASCANSGSTSNTQNRDWYSRFDVVYPSLSQYLSPAPSTTPIRRNGSQPLIPPAQ